jgi:hypothetical protein
MKKQLAVCGAIVAIGLLPWALAWSRLPDDVASHWDLYGDANGHLSRVAALAVLGGVSVLLAVAAFVRRRDVASPVLAFVATVIAVASLGTVLANRDVERWQDAHLSLDWIALGLAVAAGAAAVFAHTVKHAPAEREHVTRPSMAVGANERLAWTGTGHSGSLWFFAVFLTVGGVLLYISTSAGGLILLLVSAALAELSAVRVVVGAHGVRITPRFGFPWMTIALDRIESAEAIDVRPLSWGGWGYRGSLKLMQRAALVLRAGPGLKLNLRNGSVFVVTVDGAEDAAAVVNGLLATSTQR